MEPTNKTHQKGVPISVMVLIRPTFAVKGQTQLTGADGSTIFFFGMEAEICEETKCTMLAEIVWFY
jgi:hypothetical protein